jgi:O-antigen ligase
MSDIRAWFTGRPRVVERVGLALVTEALAGLLVLGVLAAVMLRRERAGDRLTALHIVLVILVLDTALFPQGGTSTGIFVLPINNHTTGVLFLLVPGLLFLRWLSGTARLRFSFAGAAWLLFFAWYVAEFIAGHERGNDSSAAIQEAKVIILLGGTALLIAGVPVRDLVGRYGIPRVVRWAAPIAAILTATSLAGYHTNSSFGLFRGVGTGTMGADAASVFASLGLLGLAVALSAPDHHRRGMIASGVLLIAPVFTGQRASLLGLITGFLFLALWPVLSKRHRVMHVAAKEKVAILLVLVAAAGLLSLATASGHGFNAKNSQVATSFNSPGKKDSAQSRENQWKISTGLIKEKPILGWGLGERYSHIEKIEDAPEFVVNNDLTHDIFLDILLRAGAVGLFFLLLALVSSGVAGLSAAYRHVSARVAAVGIAGTAILVEMVTRGAVESIFEKERLSVLVGIAVGICVAAGRSTKARPAASSPESDLLVVPADWLPPEETSPTGPRSLVGTGYFPQKNT